jgi:serine/threonine protein kinase/TolB-like protein
MLSAAQVARMSRLLDEALDLDPDGQRRWLEALSPENQDLESALRQALFPEQNQGHDRPVTLPAINDESFKLELASGLRAGEPVGPYRLIRPLGAGGMAEVWLAQRADGALKRQVALKLPMLSRLRRDLPRRFARERDILAGLEHPNIARLYDAGVSSEGLPYLAMEYVAGEPVNAWCDAHHLGVQERLNLFLQVLDAVQYAHSHQVIHRDIKPSNILVTDSGQVRLLDFGVAKLLAQEDDQDLTQLYGRLLTPEYASPELLLGDPIGASGDVYSLGVVLYELLCGRRPHRFKTGASVGLLEHAIATGQVEKPSTLLGPDAGEPRGTTRQELARRLRGDLDAIVLKALAREPEDRYPTAAAFADDLQRYLSGRPVVARPAHFTYRIGKVVGRHPAGFGTSVAATVLVAAALGYALNRPPGMDPFAAVTTASLVHIAPDDKSIAVLPFVDMSERKDQEYFSDGLSEELIDRLARSADLKVIARTSSFQFKGKAEDVRFIANQLGVANLLEGSVRKSGHELRITAQLIRASDGVHLWSQTYDRNLVDVFRVQDEIAGTVAQALHVAFASADQTASRKPSLEAYNHVLEGNYLKARVTHGDVDKAVQHYQKAIEINPDYALAWARLASAYLSQEAMSGTLSDDGRRRILDALDRAIRLDPKLIWAYYTRAGYEMTFAWDWAAADADHQRMHDIDPADNYLLPSSQGDVALTYGQVDRAVELYQKVVDRDPLDGYSLNDLGNAQCAANRLQDCLQSRLKLLQLHPEFGRINGEVGEARLYLGQYPEALEATQKETEESLRLAGLAMVYSAMGKRADSDGALKSLTVKFAGNDAYEIAQVHAYRGETDAAFQWLDRAYQQRDAKMVTLRADPLLRNLRSDPRFQALLTKMKFTT